MPFNGKFVKELRNRENWTQSKLARILGITLQQVSNYELGKASPKIQILDRLYKVAKKKDYYDLNFYEPPILNGRDRKI